MPALNIPPELEIYDYGQKWVLGWLYEYVIAHIMVDTIWVFDNWLHKRPKIIHYGKLI